jgi:hypothetical protein
MPSTVIRSYEYDAATGTLLIRFVSGSVYAYHNVPQDVFEKLKQFREKGIFYNQEIKNKYEYERLP